MAGCEVKAFENADETHESEKISAQMVNVAGVSVWKGSFAPGWRYTQDIEPSLCQQPHAFYIFSGGFGIAMEDGTEAEFGPDTVALVEPGHDAWTVGDEPCVFLDFGAALSRDAAAG